MIVTYYIKLFGMETDRHNGILMSLLFLIEETIIEKSRQDDKYKKRKIENMVRKSD